MTDGTIKWGNNVKVYVPSSYNDADPLATTWNDLTASAAGYSAYDDIPYDNDASYVNETSQHLYYTNGATKAAKWKAKRGDICQFLGETNPALKGYRMPRADEFRVAADWGKGGSFLGDVRLGTADGKKELIGRGFVLWRTSGAIFPAAGWRVRSSGELNYVGADGFYWSGSGTSNDQAYYMNFEKTIYTQICFLRSDAYPIRCIKD
jgi:uncharacterized protein (TIGR02145 family)